MNEIGITERGDAALDISWEDWVSNNKPAILISKNPSKLVGILKRDFNYVYMPPNIIVHATITGFGQSILEPNIPEYKTSLEGYNELIAFLGKDRVVLRVDPVVPTPLGIETAKMVVSGAKGTRIRISFIDYYDHVKQRFEKAEISLPWDTLHAPLDIRIKAWEELGKPQVCGEPGFECSGCISQKDCEILRIEPMKDEKGQRRYCACLANKHELLDQRKPCAHNCLYCYWKND
jgi:hypothetical protein